MTTDEQFSYRAMKDDVTRNQNQGSFSNLWSILCPCCELDEDQVQDYEVQNILQVKNRDPTIKLLLLGKIKKLKFNFFKGSGDSGKSVKKKKKKFKHTFKDNFKTD